MDPKVEVKKWIVNGCNLEEGIELFSKLSNNDHFLRLCRMQPEENKAMLVYQLRLIGKVSDIEFKQLKKSGTNIKVKTEQKIKLEIPKPKPKFRDDFPFLKEPNCPHELQILVGYKITAYHNYIDGHKKLFECTNLDDCTNNARNVIENYKENRLIYDELEYYKEHKHCLGKHPIFKLRKKFEEFQGMNVRDLLRLYDQTIPHRIWRIKSEMKKGDKPHLDSSRRKSLLECEAQLAEIGRILGVDNE